MNKVKKQVKKTTSKKLTSSKLNIYQKLGLVQASSNQIFKDKLNKSQSYEYFTEYQALNLLKPLLEANKLTLSFSDDASQDFFYQKSENGHIIRYLKIATLTNSEKKEEQLNFRF